MSSAIPFVFLASLPYSGSTLLSFLVNTHPAIATVGELTGLVEQEDSESYDCSCGRRLADCPFWQAVQAGMSKKGFPFDFNDFDTRIEAGRSPQARRFLAGSLRFSLLEDVRDHLVRLSPGVRARIDEGVRRNVALASTILEVTGKAVFFDASKYHMKIRQLRHSACIRLKVIHLVRDVRGACLSKRRNRGKDDWGKLLNAWVRANRNIGRHVGSLPRDRWLRVRYEDLCREPQATLDRVFEFCGLESRPIAADFLAAQHHIIGNRMRLKGIGEIRLDESWRRVLTAAELRQAVSIAGKLQEEYGYEPMSEDDLVPSRGLPKGAK